MPQYKTHYNPENEDKRFDRLLKIIIIAIATLFIWMIIFAITTEG